MSNVMLESGIVEPLVLEICQPFPFEQQRPMRAVPHLCRFENPPAETAFPLEYAFHLLGDCSGKQVVALGCGDGLNPLALASFGARVIALDRSYENLKLTDERAKAHGVEDRLALIHHNTARLPIDDSNADCVLCVAPMNSVDCIPLGRQIRRILKPGGIGVFIQPIIGSGWLGTLSRYALRPESLIDRHFPLTMERAHRVSRAVGRSGRLREFELTSRAVERMGVQSFSTIKKSHELDAWMFGRSAFARALASLLVWEARKER